VLELKNNDGELGIWQLYLFALKSPLTREKYQNRMDKFFDFVGSDGINVEDKSSSFVRKSESEGNQWVFNSVLRFMLYQIERVNKKEIVGSTVQNYLKSIKLFCEMADINIQWKKITRGLPKGKSHADDRIPTDAEIQQLLGYPDRRIKAIVYTMTSSGIRLGAWDYLKWGDIRPIEKEGRGIVAAKMIVYSGEDEEYYTFISREAFFSLKEWIRYRQDSGELICDNSWLMRDLWNTEATKEGNGFVTKPKKLASSGIKRLIERAIWAQGLRKKLENGKKRHPFSAVHSLRKWFKTRAEIAGMKPINIEKLLSHSIGISNSYYRPTENELFEDYLKVADVLSLNKETRLQKQLNEYKEKNDKENLIIKGKLQEKDEEINLLREKDKIKEDSISNLSDQLLVISQRLNQLEKG
jgi:hypothetical protein